VSSLFVRFEFYKGMKLNILKRRHRKISTAKPSENTVFYRNEPKKKPPQVSGGFPFTVGEL
jgi:hypothetical protein